MTVRFHSQVEHLLLPIDSVHQWDKNPRLGDLDAVIESIEANGYVNPVVVQKSTGVVISGNHRYAALLALGATQIPVIQVEMDDEQATRYALADNKTSDLGKYDEQLLIDLLVELQDSPQGLLGTAYTQEALEMLLNDQAAAESHGFNPVNTWTVVVTCRTEDEQAEVRDYLTAGGYSARAVNY